MNLKKQLFKPKWRHKDPEIRRQAVASGREPELLAELSHIFQSDEDPAVRIAASRRIDQPSVLLAAMDQEADGKVRHSILERLRYLLAYSAAERPPLPERLLVVQNSDDRALLEAAAQQAPEAELRSAAIEKIERQGFLGDRAIHDEDPEVRRLAAARISQESTLKRVIAATRTSDKALHQQLTERLHRERVTAGDPEAIRQQAQAACEELEQYLVSGKPPGSDELAQITGRWATVEGRAPEPLAQRFARDLQRLQNSPETRAPSQPAESAPEPPAEAQAEAEAAATAPASDEPESPDPGLMAALQSIRAYVSGSEHALKDKRIEGLARNWDKAWAQLTRKSPAEKLLEKEALKLLAGLRERLGHALERREASLQQAAAHLADMQQALEDGELHQALEHRASLHKIGQSLDKDRRWKTIQSDMQATLGRLRELRDWQHWANDKIRKRLIEEMEALPAAGLHPDAVLDRIKALQVEWKTLEASEQIPGDKHYAAAPWMWRKFNAAGRKAFEITKPFLDKRSEVQSKRLEDVKAVCEKLASLAGQESPDWQALRRAMNHARKELRSLSNIPAKARPKMARRLKAALQAGNSAMQAHYTEIEKQKLKLIREAAQLKHATDRAEAIQRAKSLQAEWKAAGSLWRSRENELWREFRAPLDPLFGELEAEREAAREQQAERLGAQRALSTELVEVLALDDAQLAEQHGRVQGLEDQWRDFRQPDRELRQRFEDLMKQFQSRERAHRHAAARAMREYRWEKADLLHRAELACEKGELDEALAADLNKAWPPSSPDHSELDQTLENRFRAALAGKKPEMKPGPGLPGSAEAARKVCINLEFLAGLPGPEKEKDLRMQYQVERLSASMSGERERVSAVDEARQLEQEWLSLGLLSERDYQALRKRVTAALSAIFEE